MQLTMTVLADDYSIVKLPARSEMPANCQTTIDSPFLSITRTPAELSIICPSALTAHWLTPPATLDSGWQAIRIEQISIPNEMPGIIAAAVNPLARAGLSVFAIASYDTDHLLVKQPDRAHAALRKAGHRLLPATTARRKKRLTGQTGLHD